MFQCPFKGRIRRSCLLLPESLGCSAPEGANAQNILKTANIPKKDTWKITWKNIIFIYIYIHIQICTEIIWNNQVLHCTNLHGIVSETTTSTLDEARLLQAGSLSQTLRRLTGSPSCACLAVKLRKLREWKGTYGHRPVFKILVSFDITLLHMIWMLLLWNPHFPLSCHYQIMQRSTLIP